LFLLETFWPGMSVIIVANSFEQHSGSVRAFFPNPDPLAFSRVFRECLLQKGGVQKLENCRRGTPLFSAGDSASDVFFLGSGLVKLSKCNLEGRELLLAILQPGAVFGAASLLGDGAHETSADVLESACVFRVPRQLFLEFCDTTPGLWRLLASVLLQQNREMKRKLELLFLYGAEQKLFHVLAELAGIYHPDRNESPTCTIPLSQREIGSMIGASRETTSVALNSLERRGVIRLARRRLTLLDVAAILEAATRNGEPLRRSAACGLW
jgi:CRP/FNR family transcriptional regulator, cyclic AMP receptor protein